MPKTLVEIPTYSDFPKLKSSAAFRKSASRVIEIKEQIKELESELLKLVGGKDGKTKVEGVLEPLLRSSGVGINETFLFMGCRFRICDESGGSRYDEKKLMAAGVTRRQLDAGLVENARKHYLKIELPKAEEEER